MYNINRQQAADILGISTRSIDRYIKSGKIRAKKDGKIVFVNSDDIKNLSNNTTLNQKVIITEKVINTGEVEINNSKDSGIVKKSDYDKILVTFEKMYTGFREEIKDKDSKIQELSIELGKAQEQKNNSIDLMEYKKVQFLSEESKNDLSKKLEKEKSEKEKVLETLKYEKTTNKLLIFFITILFIVSGVVFYLYII